MTSDINFFTENISFVIRKKGILRKWISKTAAREGKVAGAINFILCDDELLAKMNVKYLKHNTLTDILTFSNDDNSRVLSGDIFISLPRVIENAGKYNQRIEEELHRVMIHGILHMAGYGDATKSEKQVMTDKEDFYLGLLQSV
jgi:probable rRNA maturation factor